MPGIKEVYPNSNITLFLDINRTNSFQKEMLESCYSHLFDNIIEIPSKKSKEHYIQTRFGRENYTSDLYNIPDEYVDKMLNDYDKFYDLHTDRLQWMTYNFDWFKYYEFFPRPQILSSIKFEKPFSKYILINLFSDSRNHHNIDLNYAANLINSIAQNYPVVCIVTEETQPIYEKLAKEGNNIKFFSGSWGQIAKLIENCNGMVSIDSGARFLAYGFSKPIITFTKYSELPHSTVTHHLIRWGVFQNQYFPPNYDLATVLNYLSKCMNSKVYMIKNDIQDLQGEIADRFEYFINRL